MIRPVAKDVMIDIKILTNPNKFYKVKRCVELTNPNDMDLTIEGCQRPVVNNLAIGINNLKENVAIIFQTLKNKCVINVDPAQQDISVVQEHLGQVLGDLRSKIKKSYDDVVGFVVGGKAFDITNKFADKGVQLTDAICEFIEVEHIPATKMLEQNIGKHKNGINFYSHSNDIVLTNGIIDDFIKVNPRTPEQIQAAGEALFDVFEVSPKVPVRLVDEVLPKYGTNTRFL